MKGDIIARRYANALFTLGQEAGGDAVDTYSEALSALAAIVAESPDLAKVLRAPVISPREKRDVILQLLAAIGPAGENQTVRDFCLLLTDKERLALIPDIANWFTERLDEAKGVIRGELVTAIPLDKKRRNQVIATLEKETNKKLVLRFEVNSDILGGIVLRVGDLVLDASLRAQLNSLKDTIKRGV